MSVPRALALTGASGYVGSRLAAALSRDFLIVPMGRSAAPNGIRWAFDQDLPCAAEMRDRMVKILVHVAWDFSHPQPRKNWEVNVEGTRRLLDQARAAGVEQIVFVSTISAFPNAKSEYGKAKLAVEEMILSLGDSMRATVVRPGLVWGERPGGMFGSLRRQVEHGGLVPIVGNGRFPQYLVYEDDLAEILRQVCFDPAHRNQRITAAHPKPWLLRDLILRMAAEAGTTVKLIGIPWRLIYAGLKTAETLGLKPAFRSDSLLSLVHQDPSPAFTKEFPIRVFD